MSATPARISTQEHGHLTLAVDSIPAILDEMLAANLGA